MTAKILTTSVVAAAAGAVALFAGVLHESQRAGAARLSAARAAEAFEPTYSTADDTAALILRLQQHLRESASDADSFSLLGLAYQQRARETGDPSYYGKSDETLGRALRLQPGNPVALTGLASLALTRHRFRLALALAREAHAAAPAAARNYGAIGDALVELGRYREAFRAYDVLARLKPGLAAYARVSYARELRGDLAGAISAMELAAESAVPGSEAAAWAHVQLGKIYFATGRYREAAREQRVALGHVPGYAFALDALAHAEAALGRTQRAIALERRAVEATPLPQYVALLGDLYRSTGNRRAAARQYALIGAISRLLAANGVKTDLEIALFQADHGIDPRGALRRARSARRNRPSIDGDDVLAWALFRGGRCAEALPYSQRALRLSARDALKLFHRGMIERCLGHTGAARAWLERALRVSPHFSVLWAPVATRLVS
jgi:tetratricopeptide (TPR) repeat protein